MNTPEPLADALQQHHALCLEALALAEQESRALRDPDNAAAFDVARRRRQLAPRLEASLAALRAQRLARDSSAPLSAEALRQLRQTQDLIMRALVLDREN
ncbi:MAG: hypothetical protein AB1705_23905, partial [Verrucomicrobiota bacterium]